MMLLDHLVDLFLINNNNIINIKDDQIIINNNINNRVDLIIIIKMTHNKNLCDKCLNNYDDNSNNKEVDFNNKVDEYEFIEINLVILNILSMNSMGGKIIIININDNKKIHDLFLKIYLMI